MLEAMSMTEFIGKFINSISLAKSPHRPQWGRDYAIRNLPIVPGFTRFENIFQESSSSSFTVIDSLIDVRNGVLYVRSRNEPLEHVPIHCRFAVDEAPIVPDAPLLQTLTTGDRIILCQGRA